MRRVEEYRVPSAQGAFKGAVVPLVDFLNGTLPTGLCHVTALKM